MESTEQETPHRSDANRAFNRKERPRVVPSTSHSFVKSEFVEGDFIGRAIFPVGGKVSEVVAYIQDVIGSPQIQFIVAKPSADEMVNIYQFPVKKGNNDFDGFEVEKGSRLSITFTGEEEFKVEGIWVGFNYKQGGRNV